MRQSHPAGLRFWCVSRDELSVAARTKRPLPSPELRMAKLPSLPHGVPRAGAAPWGPRPARRGSVTSWSFLGRDAAASCCLGLGVTCHWDQRPIIQNCSCALCPPLLGVWGPGRQGGQCGLVGRGHLHCHTPCHTVLPRFLDREAAGIQPTQGSDRGHLSVFVLRGASAEEPGRDKRERRPHGGWSWDPLFSRQVFPEHLLCAGWGRSPEEAAGKPPSGDSRPASLTRRVMSRVDGQGCRGSWQKG